MASNSLSKRRDLLRRPIVCRKPPPTAPPVLPPPEVTCYIDPDTADLIPGGSLSNHTFSYNSALPHSDPVDRLLTTTGGTFIESYRVPNNFRHPALYTAPFMPGTYELKAVFTFSDSTICIAFATYTVLPW